MKQHLKKYAIYYQWGILILLTILTITFLYLGYQNKKKAQYTDEEINALLTLKGDIFSRMIEIQQTNGACVDKDSLQLSEEQMKQYDFDPKLFSSVSYTLKCEDNEQKIFVTIIGTGIYDKHQLTNYSSN